MSNCISIRDGAVTFSPQEMNLPALLLALEVHKDCKGFELHGRDNEMEWACQNAQWFLVKGRNLEVSTRGVRVTFGDGNSSHTWRDFRGTVLFLNKFMLRTKTHVVSLRDDDMGGGSFGRSTVIFSPNEKKHALLEDMERELSAINKKIKEMEAA